MSIAIGHIALGTILSSIQSQINIQSEVSAGQKQPLVLLDLRNGVDIYGEAI